MIYALHFKAIVDVLIHKATMALKNYKTKQLVITGGVSANSRLREMAEGLKAKGYSVIIPPIRYCTDNAAMIGYVGIKKLINNENAQLDLGPSSSSYENDFKVKLVENL